MFYHCSFFLLILKFLFVLTFSFFLVLLFINKFISFYFSYFYNVFSLYYTFPTFLVLYFCYSRFQCLFSFMALLVCVLSSFSVSLFILPFFLWVWVYEFVCSYLINVAFNMSQGFFCFFFVCICSWILLPYFYLSLFPFCAVWFMDSWCSSKGLGLNLQGGIIESRTLDHQRTPEY